MYFCTVYNSAKPAENLHKIRPVRINLEIEGWGGGGQLQNAIHCGSETDTQRHREIEIE
jgi:hypothetical protein